MLELKYNKDFKYLVVVYNVYYSNCIGCMLDILHNEYNNGNGLWSKVVIDGKEIPMNKKRFNRFLKRLRKLLKEVYFDLYRSINL